jgi:O-antigen ligase
VNERLAFSYGTAGHTVTRLRTEQPSPLAVGAQAWPAEREPRRDWAFLGLLAFTAVLYFRPQDQIPGLSALPLAEMTATLGLAAMLVGRVTKGLLFTRITPELIAVVLFGFMMLMTAPFSIWPGGAIGTFTDTFVKVILIYTLMANTLTNLQRVTKFMNVVVITTGYIATRAVFDYARGINLVENGRVQGAIGGMFENPNDLALNMVAILPMALLVSIRAKSTAWRMISGFLGVMMLCTVIVSYSRGGFVGLAAMILMLGWYMARRRPGAVAGAALALVLATPLAPSSYWERIISIVDEDLDATGSREARRIALREAWETFLTFPVHGVGAGMFQAYNPPHRVETWRETHNVVLQVAAEMGVVALLIFGFVVWQAVDAGRVTRRLLRKAQPARPRWGPTTGERAAPAVTPDEAVYFEAHAGAMTASIVGWFVCAMFASVAYNWTFYYLLALAVAPRDILAARLAARTRLPARSAAAGVSG